MNKADKSHIELCVRPDGKPQRVGDVCLCIKFVPEEICNNGLIEIVLIWIAKRRTVSDLWIFRILLTEYHYLFSNPINPLIQ